MLQVINEDILTVEYGLILQSVNCLGARGGLNGQICKKWEKVNDEYVKLIKNTKSAWKLMGTNQEIKVNDDLVVVNMFTQYDIGMSSRKTEYAAMKSCLDEIAIRWGGIKPIYIPYKISCGMGGGDWSIVNEMLEYYFELDNNVFICKL
jgi:O-acetyl-ADP-ribose deacetylase (regulator of RNase III)